MAGSILLCRHRAGCSSGNTQHLIAETLLYRGTVANLLQCSSLPESGNEQVRCQSAAVQRPQPGQYSAVDH